MVLLLCCFERGVSSPLARPSPPLDAEMARPSRPQTGHLMAGKAPVLRGGAQLSRQRAWETAVKRGKGGFPGPTSWDAMDAEELRVKAEKLLAPEVRL